ncbi:uncharacterized protein EDB91DRAFT_1164479, partial [Suillus paluster]|uniref:uncharacterized protein n=1 Tax=Suillus paluster TaxID=48578 RepID=UPI001B87E365
PKMTMNLWTPNLTVATLVVDSESEWSDGESLCELEGDGLEENLAALKAEVDALQQPAGFKFEKIMEEKTTTEWKKAEQIRALGYNGHSDRTKRRYNKIARDLADYREKRQTSHPAEMIHKSC